VFALEVIGLEMSAGEEIEKHWDNEDAHYFVIPTSQHWEQIIEEKDRTLSTCVGRIKVYPKSNSRCDTEDAEKALGNITIDDKTTPTEEDREQLAKVRTLVLGVIKGVKADREIVIEKKLTKKAEYAATVAKTIHR
jgi:hypothetical protein